MQNGVIVYLTCEKDKFVLLHSLRFLYKNYLSKFDYPVVIYHDDLTSVTKSNILVYLHQQLGRIPKITFEKLQFQLPNGVSVDPLRYDPPISDKYRMGYRHMCRFFAGEIFNHPAIQKYDWYMRLDSDSFLLSDIRYDIFERMAANNQKYGYMAEYDNDSPETTKGFFDTTMRYFKDNGVDTKNLATKLVDGVWDMSVFYTNFVLADLNFLRGEQYTNYYKHLDSTGNFYYNRWGDHDTQWFAVNTFLASDEIYCVKDIAYQHGSWVKNKEHMSEASKNEVPEPYKKWTIQ